MPTRTICWTPTWNPAHAGVGLEHLRLSDRHADSVLLAIDEQRGPLRLAYQLRWGAGWRLQTAALAVAAADGPRTLKLRTDGRGAWRDANGPLPALDGCLDIDIWPTPFTNSFPIRRQPLAIGERRTFRMAWVDGLALTVQPQRQAYTRLAERLYRFESLDGSGFTAELPVDADGVVLDYPGLFRRVSA